MLLCYTEHMEQEGQEGPAIRMRGRGNGTRKEEDGEVTFLFLVESFMKTASKTVYTDLNTAE